MRALDGAAGGASAGAVRLAQARPQAATGVHIAQARPQAATCVLCGVLPAPLLSSRARGWQGLVVELQSFHDLDVVVRASDHVIAVHLAGSVTVHRTRNGRALSRTLSVGDVTITPSGPPTRWRQAGHSLVILLRLSPSYICTVAGDECALDPDRFAIQSRFTTRDARIEDLARRLLASLEIEGADSLLYVDALACELAIHLVREHTTACAGTVWSMARLSPHKLRRAVEYIDENLRSELTLASIGQSIALSPGHFAHAFRQATGVTPHRYVLERRVERAKALLRTSDLSITEIADRVGCSSHSHFSVLFHRITGLSPRQFRAQG